MRDAESIYENFLDVEGHHITEDLVRDTLGFTDEDVYYQKKKISKSFIRLSFYNNKNPLDQMLLFYLRF